MPIIQTKIDTNSSNFKANHAYMSYLVEDLKSKSNAILTNNSLASNKKSI